MVIFVIPKSTWKTSNKLEKLFECKMSLYARHRWTTCPA